jgi:hypothetical protein
VSNPRIVVDRIEGQTAVVEVAGVLVDVPVQLLPEGAAEGTILSFRIESSGETTVSAARLQRMQAEGGIGDDFTF